MLLVASAGHTAAVAEDGKLYAWGTAEYLMHIVPVCSRSLLHMCIPRSLPHVPSYDEASVIRGAVFKDKMVWCQVSI